MANTLCYHTSSANNGGSAVALQAAVGPCKLNFFDVANRDGALRYIQLFNVTGSGDATIGEPDAVISMGGAAAKAGQAGLYFSKGIAFACATTVDGSTAPSNAAHVTFGIELLYPTGSVSL